MVTLKTNQRFGQRFTAFHFFLQLGNVISQPAPPPNVVRRMEEEGGGDDGDEDDEDGDLLDMARR